MTEAAPALEPGDVPADVVAVVKPTLGKLVSRITAKVQAEVPAFGGAASGRRHKVISNATTGAILHFLDLALGKPSSTGARVDEMFRQIGQAEAADNRELTDLRVALHIAGRESWTELRAVASQHQLASEVIGKLGEELFDYIHHLAEQAEFGYLTTKQAPASQDEARQLLLDGLLSGRPTTEAHALANRASWALPDLVVVISASVVRGPDEPAGSGLPEIRGADVLVRAEAEYLTYLCAADDRAAVIEALSAAAPVSRIAVSQPTTVADAPAAYRWTVRLFDLVERGLVADNQVLECLEHRAVLWLHAEPALRRELVQDLLAPLLSESPNSREILSETLLEWLQTRDSAPAIAARLGVHAQTVRYRWKRINELFGDSLHDPEFIVQLTMVLKASVPLWVAGDQSDFERFREDMS